MSSVLDMLSFIPSRAGFPDQAAVKPSGRVDAACYPLKWSIAGSDIYMFHAMNLYPAYALSGRERLAGGNRQATNTQPPASPYLRLCRRHLVVLDVCFRKMEFPCLSEVVFSPWIRLAYLAQVHGSIRPT